MTHSSRPLRPNLVSVGVSRLAHGTRGVSPLNKIAYVPEERRHLKPVVYLETPFSCCHNRDLIHTTKVAANMNTYDQGHLMGSARGRSVEGAEH